MIPALRQQTILSLLQDADAMLYIDDFLDKLNVSSSTLRRDLRELETQGKVRLLHGGGITLIPAPELELSITSKLPLNKEAKHSIAKKASEMIQDGDVIFLDPSSTTLELIPFLVNRHVTVVTNGIYHINLLVTSHIPSIMIGGSIKLATNSCIGPMAENALKTFHFHKCFLGSNGFSIQTGITNHDINECLIKQLAMEHSMEPVFLLDSSKYGVTTMVKVVDLAVPTIITEREIPDLQTYKNIITA